MEQKAMESKVMIKNRTTDIVLNEIIIDIKEIKGIKAIMLVVCILIIPLELYLIGERELSIALPFLMGYYFRPKLSKVFYLVPINNKEIHKYFRYKFIGMIIISILCYLIVGISVYWIFERDILVVFTDFVMRDIQMIIMLNLIVLQLDWDKNIFKNYNKKIKIRIMCLVDVYIVNQCHLLKK